jgi:predicted kinase
VGSAGEGVRQTPRLILVNGPPAVGKSTVARRFVDDHPLALCLDLDLVRSLLGRWQDDPDGAGTRARALGLEMARAHLAGGDDVIVPQLLARPEFIEALEAQADAVDASFYEIVLLDTVETCTARFLERSARRGSAGEPDPQGESLGVDVASGIAAHHQRLLALLPDRPAAHRIEARANDVDDTYRRLLRALA